MPSKRLMLPCRLPFGRDTLFIMRASAAVTPSERSMMRLVVTDFIFFIWDFSLFM